MKHYFSDDTKKMITDFLLKSFIACTRFSIQMKIKYKNAKKENHTFNLICSFFEGIYTMIGNAFSYMTSNKIEPSDPSWINTCVFVCADTKTGRSAITYDSYSQFDERLLRCWPLNHKIVLDPTLGYKDVFYFKYLNATQSFNWRAPSQLENTLLIGKVCPNTMRIKFANNADSEQDLSIAQSSARFLEIEYKCGDMNGFEIDVPKSHYIVGNEILSKTYVLRYLEHLPIYVRWFFDDSKSELRIVDHDSNVFSLRGNQYIKLLEDGYEILELDKAQKDAHLSPTTEQLQCDETTEN